MSGDLIPSVGCCDDLVDWVDSGTGIETRKGTGRENICVVE